MASLTDNLAWRSPAVTKRTCSPSNGEGCGRPTIARGLCGKHYQQVKPLHPEWSRSVRPIVTDGIISAVTLTKGRTAIIDTVDVPLVDDRNWYAQKANGGTVWYARSSQTKAEGGANLHLHRVILGLTPDDPRLVDHRNGDGLDNRRANLRVATRSENTRNRVGNLLSYSQYKGVHWHKVTAKWQATVNHESAGYYDSEVEAAMAVDQLARKRYGEFARYNFPCERELLAEIAGVRPPSEVTKALVISSVRVRRADREKVSDEDLFVGL